jgi:hypothetical protein
MNLKPREALPRNTRNLNSDRQICSCPQQTLQWQQQTAVLQSDCPVASAKHKAETCQPLTRTREYRKFLHTPSALHHNDITKSHRMLDCQLTEASFQNDSMSNWVFGWCQSDVSLMSVWCHSSRPSQPEDSFWYVPMRWWGADNVNPGIWQCRSRASRLGSRWCIAQIDCRSPMENRQRSCLDDFSAYGRWGIISPSPSRLIDAVVGGMLLYNRVIMHIRRAPVQMSIYCAL